uniref:G_PROTEIN_RECEP_F1_2 domain-containing protein n=1 Tax=Heterorhabditis bacteriophora TaxID=37862 RepID=A0A1I7W8P0_HETBA
MLKITNLRLSMLHICDSIQCIFVTTPLLFALTLYKQPRCSAFHLIFLPFIKCYILYNCYNCLILIVLLLLCVLRYHTANKLRVASPPSRPAWQEKQQTETEAQLL